MGRVVERGVELIEVHRFHQDRYGARPGDIAGETGNQDDLGLRIFCHNVAAGRRTIQFWHLVIHEDDVGMVTAVGLDRLEAGADYLDHFMLATPDKLSQRGPDVPVVVCNQDTHGCG